MAFDANPSTGVEIYETSPRSGKGSWQIYGGTSLGALAWAGIIAIVDQGRALAGKGSLDGPTQTLPALYALPASDFHHPSPNEGLLGSGGLSSILADLFTSDHSGATANIATGLGSPGGPSLITDLVSSTITTNRSTTSVGDNGTTANSGTGAARSPVTKGNGSRHHQVDQRGHSTAGARRTIRVWLFIDSSCRSSREK